MVQPRKRKAQVRRDRRSKLILVFSLLILVGCKTEQSEITAQADAPVNRWSTDKAWAVLQAQDHRDTDALCTYLQDSIWQIRRASALAFASVRSGDAASCLKPALHDRKSAVRAAAAFAMGLCGNTDEAEEMVDMLRFEHEASVRYALWEAVGRTGDELTLNRLLDQQVTEKQDSLGLAWALYSMALDGYANDSSVHTCFELLLSNDVPIRLGAAHALARTKKELLETHKQTLAKWISMEPLTEIRMALIRAYGKNTESDDLMLLSTHYAKAKSLERVNILRALRGASDNPSLLLLQQATNEADLQVAKTAAAILIARADHYPDLLAEYVKGIRSDEVRSMVYAAALRASDSKGRIAALMNEQFSGSEDPYVLAHCKAITLEKGKLSPVNDMVSMAMAESSSLIEKTAATQALFNWLERNPKLGKDELLGLSKLLNSKDPGVLADVATFISSNGSLKGNDSAQLSQFAAYSIKQLNLPQDLEAKIYLENAIAHLAGKEAPEHQTPPFNHPIDRTRLDALPNGQEYLVKTSKGDIRMISFVDETPSSCLAFDSLVTAGYYNGKSFHRVVPNFVAQGGCPRGDGYGSMDWTLRTEIGLSRYVTGSVGLASAGADTESCQFFFTHSPTPHLDGRYTRFAQVTEGMDVVNALQRGDLIESISKQ